MKPKDLEITEEQEEEVKEPIKEEVIETSTVEGPPNPQPPPGTK